MAEFATGSHMRVDAKVYYQSIEVDGVIPGVQYTGSVDPFRAASLQAESAVARFLNLGKGSSKKLAEMCQVHAHPDDRDRNRRNMFGCYVVVRHRKTWCRRWIQIGNVAAVESSNVAPMGSVARAFIVDQNLAERPETLDLDLVPTLRSVSGESSQVLSHCCM
ncbi:hypothetical protein BDW02DRAFT_82230 [Decorospora gaudefroyi]|uniref:Uncharacterized protein n=1 Tax=Decorospora gaudefroyi TaxID=184978 RepID=A0A6A5KPC9_9PLEO|nr:hypothetical protein BDW02DRAFT_82230 [Decorospora gaudefroyi]